MKDHFNDRFTQIGITDSFFVVSYLDIEKTSTYAHYHTSRIT